MAPPPKKKRQALYDFHLVHPNLDPSPGAQEASCHKWTGRPAQISIRFEIGETVSLGFFAPHGGSYQSWASTQACCGGGKRPVQETCELYTLHCFTENAGHKDLLNTLCSLTCCRDSPLAGHNLVGSFPQGPSQATQDLHTRSALSRSRAFLSFKRKPCATCLLSQRSIDKRFCGLEKGNSKANYLSTCLSPLEK